MNTVYTLAITALNDENVKLREEMKNIHARLIAIENQSFQRIEKKERRAEEQRRVVEEQRRVDEEGVGDLENIILCSGVTEEETKRLATNNRQREKRLKESVSCPCGGVTSTNKGRKALHETMKCHIKWTEKV